MESNELLVESFGRVREVVEGVLDGLDRDAILAAPGPGANPIGWLVWHIARGQDAQVAQLTGDEQVWITGGWASRFGLEPDPANMGYGHGPAEVAAVQPESVQVLLDYYDAVWAVTEPYLRGITTTDLD